MLEERELKEWEAREEEMRKEQDERLGVLMANLRARDEKQQELVAARVDKVLSFSMLPSFSRSIHSLINLLDCLIAWLIDM